MATIQVPVVLPAGERTVTATVDPTGPSPLATSNQLQLEFLSNEAIEPTVTAVSPADATPGVNPSTSVVVTFSERIAPASVTTGTVRLLDGALAEVPATVTLSPNRLSATLIPDAPLGLATTYTVDVTTAVTDLVGNDLSAPFTSTFTTWDVPAAPTDVGATPGDQSASVTWTAPLDDGGTPIVGFDVSVYDELGAVVDGLGGTAGPTATSFEVTGLDNGTAYQFAVAAVNSAGSGPLSGFAGPVTPVSAPDAPTDVTATPVDVQTAGFNNGVVTVSWTAPDNNGSNITGYTVRYGGGNVEGCTTTTETTCDVTGLPVGVPLSFNVTATNASGDGPASAGVLATAADGVRCPGVAGGDSRQPERCSVVAGAGLRHHGWYSDHLLRGDGARRTGRAVAPGGVYGAASGSWDARSTG